MFNYKNSNIAFALECTASYSAFLTCYTDFVYNDFQVSYNSGICAIGLVAAIMFFATLDFGKINKEVLWATFWVQVGITLFSFCGLFYSMNYG